MRYKAQHFYSINYRWRYTAARYFLLAAVIFFVLGVAMLSAAQSGIAIQNRLVNHQHTASGDGGILQGLSPVGNFKISGNNAGNIAISSSITGSNFIWKPSSTSFIAGQATDDSFYVNNIGGFSWIGGYNSMSRGDYSLAFGTHVKNYRAASIAMGYYLRNNAGNSIMFGSGPGFGGNAYAVNDDTGSIKFFPFTTTSETRPMLNMKRDNTAEAVGVWNFISSPTINGVALSTAIGVDNTKVLKTGDTMSGQLTLAGSSLTVRGTLGIMVEGTSANAGIVYVKGTTGGLGRIQIVDTSGGAMYIGSNGGYNTILGANNGSQIMVASGGGVTVTSTFTVQGSDFSIAGSTLVCTSGKCGIGVAAPAYILDVLSPIASDTARIKSNTSATAMKIWDSGNEGLDLGGGSTYGAYVAADGNYSLRLLTNAAERMTLTAAGNVGISTTTPAILLDVQGQLGAKAYTLAQMNALAPGRAGAMISVSDAAAPYSYCVSTGTAAGAWVQMNTATHCQ